MKQFNNNVLSIKPFGEKVRITSFIKTVLQKQSFENVIIAMSGGIDSATSFYLLKEVLPPQNIIVSHLYYFESYFKDLEPILKKAGIPRGNIYNISISPLVKYFQQTLFPFRHSGKRSASWRRAHPESVLHRVAMRDSGQAVRRPELTAEWARMTMGQEDRIRLGNIMARVRMIILYDLAKKHNALVCGTENKSEYLLGYFTRFGDQASDFEPIQHLYKTQVYRLAKSLKVPKAIIEKTPTAGLWKNQTDEKEFGFSYPEADQVLYLYYDKKLKLEEIKKRGLKNAEKIINFSFKNSYKHHAPYTL